MAAAATVFREKGFRNATIDDIAGAAGISRPTVYKYTKSKQHLLDLMVDAITDHLGAGLRDVLDSQTSAVARLQEYVSVQVDAAIANTMFYAIVFSEEVELSSAGRKAFRQWAHSVTADFQNLLEEYAAEVGAPATGISIKSHLILSMLTSLHRWYRPMGPVSRDDLVQEALGLIEGGLRSAVLTEPSA